MPATVDEKDKEWTSGDDWVPGQFKGRYEELQEHCSPRYTNFRMHRGYFEQSVDEPFVASLDADPPALIWIDCDSSTKTTFERILNKIPNGCVICFDDLENLNYGTRLTGESRLVHEINTGVFGDNIELIPDFRLSLHSRRICRFFRLPPNRLFERVESANLAEHVRDFADGSPLP